VELTTKAQIIMAFAEQQVNNTDFDDFYNYHDLGVPLAICMSHDLVTLNDTGIEVINETYDSLCEILGVDNNKNYNNFDEFIPDKTIEE
jgi:cystathionine beta-lyase family protein involved in aluminum resistance